MKQIFNIKNKWVCITGGTGYLGNNIAKYLLEQGANVIVISTNKSKFDRVFYKKRNIYHVKTDLSKKNNFIKKIISITPKIDVLINNAHYGRGGNPSKLNNNDWEIGIDGTINLYYRVIRDFLPLMPKNSSIINISSIYGVITPDFDIYGSLNKVNPPNYGAGKAAIIHLTKYFSNLLANHNIRVNCITPGVFCRPINQGGMDNTFRKKIIKKIPLNRIGVPEDLFGAIVFFSSPSSNYITGQNLIIDGGMTNKN